MKNKLFLVVLALMAGFFSEAKTITIKSTKPIQEQFSKEGVIYKIKTTIDLGGADIVLPKDSRLKFSRKGVISNGRIIGNNTQITAKERTIFDNIIIDGQWLVPEIYVSWMRLSNENCQQQIQEIF